MDKSSDRMKLVGRVKNPEDLTPEENLRKAIALIREMDRINPYPRPRGFVFKARTWEEYEKWRKSQDNPRLW